MWAVLNYLCLRGYNFAEDVFNKLSTLDDEDSIKKSSVLNGLMSGDLDHLLGLRKNMAHYTVFLDTFAPAIVSVQTWNNSNLVSDACSGDAGAFEKLLSVSDEAFMLVTMVSYVPTLLARLKPTLVLARFQL